MGAADSVPGVSGGTIAMITGIYERLISAVSTVDHMTAHGFLDSFLRRDFEAFKKEFHEMDAPFLIALSLGIVTSIIVVLRYMHYLLSHHPVPTYGFFFGLIAVSAAVLYRDIDISTTKSKIAALTGFMFAFTVSGFAVSSLGHSIPVLFVAGAVAISAMVLPGVSGSLMLLILGQYEYMTSVLKAFTDSLLKVPSQGLQAIDSFTPIVAFMLGAGLGLATITRAVKKAFENHRNLTMAFLVSLIAGALRSPVHEARKTVSGDLMVAVPEFLVAAVLGGALIYLIDRKAGMLS